MKYRGLPSEEKQGDLTVYRVPCFRSGKYVCYFHELTSYIFSALVKVLRLSRSKQYDVIHAHFVFPTGIVAYLLHRITGIPYVITAHGSDVKGYNPDRFKWIHWMALPFWRAIVRNAAAVTSPSVSLADLIRSNCNDLSRIDIIPNGIQMDWVVPREKRKKMLVVSRLFKRKGVQDLLRVLAETSTGFELHIVGDGPYRPKLEVLAEKVKDPVTFWGWIPNHSEQLKELYSTASIFIFLSTSENFPVCLLESMLAGTAVLATNLKACVEVLGDAALYVRPGDLEDIKAVLLKMTSDPSLIDSLGKRARERVQDRFVWNKIGYQYHALLFSVAKQGGGARVEQ